MLPVAESEVTPQANCCSAVLFVDQLVDAAPPCVVVTTVKFVPAGPAFATATLARLPQMTPGSGIKSGRATCVAHVDADGTDKATTFENERVTRFVTK